MSTNATGQQSNLKHPECDIGEVKDVITSSYVCGGHGLREGVDRSISIQRALIIEAGIVLAALVMLQSMSPCGNARLCAGRAFPGVEIYKVLDTSFE